MAYGLTATLMYENIIVQNGYVELFHVSGGPNRKAANPEFTMGCWNVFLRYYSSIERRRDNIENNLALKDPAYTVMEIAYVPGVDPYQLAFEYLQQWFPDGVPTEL